MTIAKQVAKSLLDIKAVSLSPQDPFHLGIRLEKPNLLRQPRHHELSGRAQTDCARLG